VRRCLSGNSRGAQNAVCKGGGAGARACSNRTDSSLQLAAAALAPSVVAPDSQPRRRAAGSFASATGMANGDFGSVAAPPPTFGGGGAHATGCSPTSAVAVNWADAWDELSSDEWEEGEQAPEIALPTGDGGGAVVALPPAIGLPGAAAEPIKGGDSTAVPSVALPPAIALPGTTEEDDQLSPLPPTTQIKHYKSGGRYEGPLKPETGLPHGDYGVFYYPIGHRYEGPWQDGEKHGELGIFHFCNGARFEGEWERNARVGIGTQYDQSGRWQRSRYVGNRVVEVVARGIGGE
jgi:hypothetical protein